MHRRLVPPQQVGTPQQEILDLPLLMSQKAYPGVNLDSFSIITRVLALWHKLAKTGSFPPPVMRICFYAKLHHQWQIQDFLLGGR